MPRIARVVVPGLPHHIVQRGNNRQDVFFAADDYRAYLDLLHEQSQRFGLHILAYCLMTNHVHLIALPGSEQALARAVGRTHWLYSRYINRLHGRSGHLWQNRFFSCPLDADHLLHAARYVERNPVRAHMVRLPWRYRWSSAAAHTGEGEPHEVLDMVGWRRLFRPAAWKKMLQEAEDEPIVDRLRRCMHTGRPLASDRLIARLEARLGVRLRANPVGRPRKKKKKRTARS
jgi:putative transposase